jgi:hypothetical protein
MKRSKDANLIASSAESLGGQKSTNLDIISKLPKDLRMQLVSFLKLKETLVLAACSSRLNAAFTVNEVWQDFIKRVSPSLLALPMNTLGNYKQRLQVILGLWPERIDYTKLRLHYILRVMGTIYTATLSNPTVSKVQERFSFFSGQDFDAEIPYHRAPFAGLMVLLINNGKTSVLLREVTLYENDLEQNEVTFISKAVPSCDLWMEGGDVGVTFKWKMESRNNSGNEEHEYNPGYFTGVDSVTVDLSYCGSKMDEYLRRHLIWY